MNTALYTKLSLVIAAMVLLVGATVASDYLGKNKGQFAAVSTPSCYSDEQIATLNAEKAAIETNMASTTTAYNTATSEITRLTALLTPTATVTAKYTEAQGYKTYVTPYYKKNNTKLWTANFHKYNIANTAYNTMVANNTAYSAQITTNTNNKTTYQNSLTSLTVELTAKDAEIVTANGKKCEAITTTTTGGGTTYTPVPSRFDGTCSGGTDSPDCMDADCFVEGLCPDGPGNPSCTSSSQCATGEACNTGSGYCEPIQPDGGPCMSNDQCNSGLCEVGNCKGSDPGAGAIRCCVCYYDTSLPGSYDNCTANYKSIGCEEPHDVPYSKSLPVANIDDNSKAICKYDPNTNNKQVFSIYSMHSNSSQCDDTFVNAMELAESGASGGTFHSGCRTCQSLDQNMEGARAVQAAITDDNQVIYVSGNQNSTSYYPDESSAGFCDGGGVLYKITKASIEVVFSDCPAEDSWCESPQSRTCARNGTPVAITCVADSEGSPNGKWK